jgi:hypothetical protein
MAITTDFKASLSVALRNSVDLGSNSGSRALAIALALANGTGAGQADLAYTDSRTLAASATEDLDLAGVLAGVDGATLTFARVKLVVVTAAAGNTNNVNLTRPASNGVPLFLAAGDGVAVRPGGFAVVGVGSADAVGYAVTASTGDLLTLTNSSSGTPVTYSVAIVGCSA